VTNKVPGIVRRGLLAGGIGAMFSPSRGSTAATPVAAAMETHMPLANGIQKMTFERSGGLFPLALSGTVLLAGATPGVESEASTGLRPLTPDELAMFAGLDPARLRSAASPLTPPVPDGYQWDVTLEFAGAAPIALRWHANGAPPRSLAAVAPGMADLAAWVRREVDRIWAHRTGAPPP